MARRAKCANCYVCDVSRCPMRQETQTPGRARSDPAVGAEIHSPILDRPLPRIRLGDLVLQSNLLLAPIAGYTDLSFRLISRRQGAVGLACTDLLCPQGVLRQNFRTQVLMQTCPEDSPLCVQLFGGEDDPLIEAARWCQDAGARVIDINMGCPVEKITGRNGGAALLCDPARTVKLVERVISAVPHAAVTAKLRLGWDDDAIIAPQLARQLEEAGVRMITVHGRTRKMGFSGQVRHDAIAEVVAAVRRIPVIGNGDIRTVDDAIEMLRRTRCAGLMLGRGALSAPWLFHHIWHYLTTGQRLSDPTLEEKCAIIRDHFELHRHYRGDRPAICEFRQRITWYAKHLNPCRPLRDGMRTIQTPDDFHRVLNDFMVWSGVAVGPTCER